MDEQVERLRREVRALQRTVERQNAAHEQFARRVEDLTRNTEEIVHSRIWRSLCAVGAPLLRATKWLPVRDATRGTYDFHRARRTRDQVGRLRSKPLISVLVRGRSKRTRASIAAQVYPNYELVSDLDGAKGEYVCFVDDRDELSPDALLAVAEWVDVPNPADVVYSDEYRVGEGTFFKPDWSPDLLLSTNYIGRPLGVKTERVRNRVGYDLLLGLMAEGAVFSRIPEVLYQSSAGSRSDEEKRALERYLGRASPGAYVQAGPVDGYFRVRYPIPPGSRVSIIIPSGGNAEMLNRNLEGIAQCTDYADYEIVVIDNSRGEAIRAIAETYDVRYIDWRVQPFNFSEICNQAAGQCDSPLLLFLNDDVVPLTPGWLRAMVELAARPEVGVVGAKLLFPDGTIQHAGVVLGLFGRSGHAFKHAQDGSLNYFHLADAIRNVSAVTGACLMIRNELFRKLGGFDESNFPVDSNDIDLCLRAAQAGYRVLYTPYALLRHDEAASKSPADLRAHPSEIAAFHERWKDQIENDRFYNPNLTRDAEDFSAA